MAVVTALISLDLRLICRWQPFISVTVFASASALKITKWIIILCSMQDSFCCGNQVSFVLHVVLIYYWLYLCSFYDDIKHWHYSHLLLGLVSSKVLDSLQMATIVVRDILFSNSIVLFQQYLRASGLPCVIECIFVVWSWIVARKITAVGWMDFRSHVSFLDEINTGLICSLRHCYQLFTMMDSCNHCIMQSFEWDTFASVLHPVKLFNFLWSMDCVFLKYCRLHLDWNFLESSDTFRNFHICVLDWSFFVIYRLTAPSVTCAV